jgi:type I restriction enzyme S subunit
LPKGWATVSLADVGDWGSGGTPRTTEPRYYEGDVPWIRSGDLPDGPIREHPVCISEEAVANSAAKWVPAGAVLIAMYGATIGKLGLTTYPVTTNQAVATCQCSDAVLPQFLFWLLRRMRPDLIEMGQGGAQPNISQQLLKKLEIALPPLAEQRRIVAKLDQVMARTARARAELARIPALITHHKRAILETVFSNASWKRFEFFDVLNFKGGSQPPKSTFSNAPGPGLVRLLQIRDFASDEKAVFIEDSSRWPKCEADDIMVGRYGASVGKILTGKAGAYNVALVKMIVDPRLLRRFVYYWLQSSVFQEALGIVSRSAQDGFNKGDLESVLVPVPSLEEQEAAVQMIDDALGRLERAAQEHAQATRLLNNLDQALLAKAFRGELVPQDPADEPAAALLARIRAERQGAAPPSRKRKARA